MIGCRVAVPRSHWLAVPTLLFIYIYKLLRDSFSVSQPPPIWEPPSHYSMNEMNCPCNGQKWEIKQKSLHLYFQNKILRSEVEYTSTVSKRSGGARSRLHRMTSSLTVASPLAGGHLLGSPLAGGPLLPLPLLHQVRLTQEHLDTRTIQVTKPS